MPSIIVAANTIWSLIFLFTLIFSMFFFFFWFNLRTKQEKKLLHVCILGLVCLCVRDCESCDHQTALTFFWLYINNLILTWFCLCKYIEYLQFFVEKKNCFSTTKQIIISIHWICLQLFSCENYIFKVTSNNVLLSQHLLNFRQLYFVLIFCLLRQFCKLNVCNEVYLNVLKKCVANTKCQ